MHTMPEQEDIRPILNRIGLGSRLVGGLISRHCHREIETGEELLVDIERHLKRTSMNLSAFWKSSEGRAIAPGGR